MDATAKSMTIEQLYQAYHQPLLRYIERIVHNRETAEDLCQEAFMKAFRHWHQHEADATLRAWLYRIAANTAYDYLRQQRRGIPSDIDPTEIAVESSLDIRLAESAAIHGTLRQIPEQYRLPLLLHAYAGYDLKTIAKALGCNVNTIKTRVYRARARFRQIYAV